MKQRTSIYKIQSKINPNRLYIGSSVNYKKRWNHHISDLRKGVHHSAKLQRHFNKYGEDDLQFVVIMGCDKDDILDKEQFFLDSMKPYFNSCPIAGTCKNMPRSSETIEKQRKSMTGKKWTEEQRQRFSMKLKGNKHIPEEVRLKISEKLKGRKANPCSERTKKKLSEERMGAGNPMFGKKSWNSGLKNPYSRETIQKMKSNRKGKEPWNKGMKKVNGEYILTNGN